MQLLAIAISILVELAADGSAAVTENWDIDAVEGTEWYLVRSNLGDIAVSDLSVSENGREFLNEGSWDIDRSLAQKAFRCGIVSKKDGCEICWGLGSMGHHDFIVKYRMSNVVKSLSDYDCFHMQLVSPGLSTPPDEVEVRISAPVPLSSGNAGIWGFGFNGTSGFRNGEFVLASTEKFKKNSSVIALVRFEKGIFHSSSVQESSFDEVLKKALKGSKFEDDARTRLQEILATLLEILKVIFPFLFAMIAGFAGSRATKRSILGCREKDVEWCRDIPFAGDILQSSYVLDRLGSNGRDNVAAAMILRMIQHGQLKASKDASGNIELSFDAAADLSTMGNSERSLYDMMKEASGEDVILQKNEFSRWSRKHNGTILKWIENVNREGQAAARASGCLNGSKFTPEGQKKAREVVGFRKFLKDFTLLEVRASNEVVLWQDYLVYGALYGIADKVAKELREINPDILDQSMMYDYDTTCQLVWLTRSMAGSITNVRAAAQSSGSGASRSGMGGFTSFGGGGGFSGGGFGGGAR